MLEKTATARTEAPPRDFQEHLARLEAAGLLTRVDRPIDKDTELHPLVRWMFQGGLHEDQRRAWLWVTASREATVFDVALSRGQAQAKRQLGDAPVGTIVTDRYGAYGFVDVERRQLCWAHTIRTQLRVGTWLSSRTST